VSSVGEQPGVVAPYYKRTSHGFHLVMTIVTAGLWAPVWFFVAWSNKKQREQAAAGNG